MCTYFACVRGCLRRGFAGGGGRAASRQVKSGGEKRSGRKREGAYCFEVILLDRGFRLSRRRVRARYANADLCVCVCVFILYTRLIHVRESSKDYCLRSRPDVPVPLPNPCFRRSVERWRVFKYPRDANVLDTENVSG